MEMFPHRLIDHSYYFLLLARNTCLHHDFFKQNIAMDTFISSFYLVVIITFFISNIKNITGKKNHERNHKHRRFKYELLET